MAPIFRKILCPVDFSENSIAALDEAAKLARKDNAMVYLMHVEFVAMNKPAELADYDITLSTEPARFRLEEIALLGGQNASLGEMTRKMHGQGIPVPGGFAVTASAYWGFLDANDRRSTV